MTWIDAARRAKQLRASLAIYSLNLVFLLGVPESARAQGATDAAAARGLFSEARKLVEQGKYAEACPKFEESLRLKAGIGTRFNLADCWEKVGRTATAWGEFMDVASAAKASGQKDREVVARERAAALEGKLSYLAIDVVEDDPELRVTRDGVVVGRGAFGTAIPIDPGPHVIEASSPTKKKWSTRTEVGSGAQSRVAIPKLEPLESALGAESPAATPDPPPRSAPSDRIQAGTKLTESDGPRGFGTQRAIGLGLGGLGVAGLAVGTLFLLDSDSKNDEAKKLCPTLVCDRAEITGRDALVEDARGQRTMSYVGFGAGGALIVAGAVVFFTAGTGRETAKTGLGVAPLARNGARGLVLHGSW